jgi:hypothetical protein
MDLYHVRYFFIPVHIAVFNFFKAVSPLNVVVSGFYFSTFNFLASNICQDFLLLPPASPFSDFYLTVHCTFLYLATTWLDCL